RRSRRCVVEDRRRRQVSEQRDRCEYAAALTEHEHRVERVEPGAAVLLVDQQPRPAGVLGGRPEVRQRVGLAVERFARGLERLVARERSARGLTEEFLLVGEGQVHWSGSLVWKVVGL